MSATIKPPVGLIEATRSECDFARLAEETAVQSSVVYSVSISANVRQLAAELASEHRAMLARIREQKMTTALPR